MCNVQMYMGAHVHVNMRHIHKEFYIMTRFCIISMRSIPYAVADILLRDGNPRRVCGHHSNTRLCKHIKLRYAYIVEVGTQDKKDTPLLKQSGYNVCSLAIF